MCAISSFEFTADPDGLPGSSNDGMGPAKRCGIPDGFPDKEKPPDKKTNDETEVKSGEVGTDTDYPVAVLAIWIMYMISNISNADFAIA